ncbi:MAG TPA: hypothetical protein VFK47_23870, partial [Ktedonobacteraceae bacterium]|nr:hypothetical protein [Ktedonobacteraceae bacterium]
MKRIYVASSWRNKRQESVVAILRAAGHAVYDFKNPTKGDYPNPDGIARGFHWSEIDQNYKEWQPHQYIAALEHPLSDQGFTSDMGALHWCDTCVLVLPCGRSA